MISKRSLIFAAFYISVTLTAQNTKFEGASVVIPENASRDHIIKLSTQVRPSYRQLDYQQREMLGFIHIGMNTVTGKEWGTGSEDPILFNPSELNAEEWIKTFKNAGITAVILVAKHHDGFCMWPSKYTDHNVTRSPWRNSKGDLVKEVADACHKHEMKLCIYLSPWDMHEKTYGTYAYNDYYIHQLEELLTNYGPVYLLWFDGAGTSKSISGHEMPFDWERIFRRSRELQPDILLSGNAPDIRWVGNEAGKGRETEWCVQGINNMEPLFGTLVDYNAMSGTLGSIDDLMKKKRMAWYPSRGGLPLRKGWFYNAHDDSTTKSLEYLVNSYFSTIGQNSNLLPNLSPNQTGRIPAKDAQRLVDFGNIIKRMKAVDYAKGAKVTPISGWTSHTPPAFLTDDTPFTSWHTNDGVTSAVAEVELKKPAKINVIKLQENVRDFGQRVEAFAIDVITPSGWKEIARSTTIGFRRMIRLSEPANAKKFRIRVLNARVSISWGNLSMYYLEDVPKENVQASSENEIPISDMHILRNGSDYIFKLNQPYKLAGLSYIPKEDGDKYIENYVVYLSNDGKKWDEPVASGRFGNIENNPVEQYIPLKKKEALYIRLKVLNMTSSGKKPATAEFKILIN